MRLDELAAEGAAISLANKTIAGGGAMAGAAWWLDVGVLGLLGFLVAVAGLLANLYFSHKRNAREHDESRARIAIEREARAHAQRLAEAEHQRQEELHRARLAAIVERCDL